jgi:hypothetical protein
MREPVHEKQIPSCPKAARVPALALTRHDRRVGRSPEEWHRPTNGAELYCESA